MTYVNTKHNSIFEFNTDYSGNIYYISRLGKNCSYIIYIASVINSLNYGYSILMENIEELEL